MPKCEDTPKRAKGEALPERAEKNGLALKATLETIRVMYKDRPFLAFFLVRGVIHALDDKRSAKPWIIGGSITFLGSGAVVAARAAGLF
jgi:hypothetical protein